ncbi:hypothetical protein [Comamonas serinivorans]|uniref:hypothetical protein n=1 Tax=Comamonas serinivorans TaxID=1082851 RepID=UPI0012FAA161|nr:hypothetical protein [Comamonas serinivorans]
MNYIPDGYTEVKKRAMPVRTQCTCQSSAQMAQSDELRHLGLMVKKAGSTGLD